ncbi:hypothetical protein LIER_06682 [Lithospermum erythrorhizon]|uniref:RRM domain-containing protein n=1 Tax=Lithospermum erythrorhizon TaxID=34254 RepID=A0AAV3P5E8_LITER
MGNMNLNFAAALANTEVKKQDAGRMKVVIHKDQTTLNQQKSVYISRLPVDVTVQQLLFALRKFGPVKLDSITIRRTSRGSSGHFCHAFAEFQSAQHASDAVKPSKFTVGAAQPYISYRN